MELVTRIVEPTTRIVELTTWNLHLGKRWALGKVYKLENTTM